ncbi:sigma factor-like helix-turn-helix DNA-binding protein [Mycolicibacterium obuense]|uniref:RNA polymerase sigma factor SigF n=1 Tax=Mycolicibacterium obuense TaxID=1807 RepID=A0A0J6VU99_9MYCO|nr:sigma factor-like helix-turn-helix DNA-binding protein [Mycolicibacterium obuense]KMO73048.1 RNA polymerase sigma factor SigF [Mycolicibacterium obuense]
MIETLTAAAGFTAPVAGSRAPRETTTKGRHLLTDSANPTRPGDQLRRRPTQSEIAEQMGSPQMHVPRLLTQSLRRLRDDMLDRPHTKVA